jgi:prevent-host-death family protein
MKNIPISEFKAKCLGILEQVRSTRRPIVVTRYGKPVAEVIPPSPPRRSQEWLGSLRETARIQGDIVSPISAPEDWEASAR